MKVIKLVAGVLCLAVLLVPVLVWAEKEPVRDEETGEIIGYKDTAQDGRKTIVTLYGPDGETVLKKTTTEVEEKDDGTIVTTIVEVVVEVRPDGTKVETTTTTIIEEFPNGPIAKKITTLVVATSDGQVLWARKKVTIIDHKGDRQTYGVPPFPAPGTNPDRPIYSTTPVGERE